jgi:hypothetical protein
MGQTKLGNEAAKAKLREMMCLPPGSGVYITDVSARKAKADWRSYFVKVILPDGASNGYTLNQMIGITKVFQTENVNRSQTHHTDCSTCGNTSYITFMVLKSPIELFDDYVDDP